MSKINFSSLSDYRTELMGAAMLFVMLFHVGMDRHSTFYALHRIGNVGVTYFCCSAASVFGSHGRRSRR